MVGSTGSFSQEQLKDHEILETKDSEQRAHKVVAQAPLFAVVDTSRVRTREISSDVLSLSTCEAIMENHSGPMARYIALPLKLGTNMTVVIFQDFLSKSPSVFLEVSADCPFGGGGGGVPDADTIDSAACLCRAVFSV